MVIIDKIPAGNEHAREVCWLRGCHLDLVHVHLEFCVASNKRKRMPGDRPVNARCYPGVSEAVAVLLRVSVHTGGVPCVGQEGLSVHHRTTHVKVRRQVVESMAVRVEEESLENKVAPDGRSPCGLLDRAPDPAVGVDHHGPVARQGDLSGGAEGPRVARLARLQRGAAVVVGGAQVPAMVQRAVLVLKVLKHPEAALGEDRRVRVGLKAPVAVVEVELARAMNLHPELCCGRATAGRGPAGLDPVVHPPAAAV
mmetsp:Transcript_40300/g.95763  ORF Transcript_40300/g.95763 Transcript_40300/m.95763 type:complete len:254 (-) Transcript_40300:3043-3804(-)